MEKLAYLNSEFGMRIAEFRESLTFQAGPDEKEEKNIFSFWQAKLKTRP